MPPTKDCRQLFTPRDCSSQFTWQNRPPQLVDVPVVDVLAVDAAAVDFFEKRYSAARPAPTAKSMFVDLLAMVHPLQQQPLALQVTLETGVVQKAEC